MKKKVLITGAAGFIGFHLALYLHQRGDIVIGYDNLNDYYDLRLKQARSQLLKKNGITLILGDVCDKNHLSEVLETHQITHCAHLAAQAGVRYSLLNPQAYIKANLEGFLNILEICREKKSIKLTYASSSSVYGLTSETPFSVNQRTDRQASFYGVTKKTNELMASTYHHLFGIPSIGLRFFTVYGPWGRPDMAYYSFAGKIWRDEPIDLFNHGKMMRDFTYVDDIVKGTAAAIDRQTEACELFNLGNHHPEELVTLVNFLEKGIGKVAKKNYLPMQPGDVVSTFADIESSQKLLSYEPAISLEEGIERFILWYRKEGCHFQH